MYCNKKRGHGFDDERFKIESNVIYLSTHLDK
jgi:hypothetical protein